MLMKKCSTSTLQYRGEGGRSDKYTVVLMDDRPKEGRGGWLSL